MNLKKKTNEELENLSCRCKDEIVSLKNALNIIPETSVLGRLGIRASIRMWQKHLDEVENELKNRTVTTNMESRYG